MKKKVKFGVAADIHMTLTPDVVEKMQTFLDDCRKEDVDFIIQLGDFTWPPSNQLRCLDYSNGDKLISMFNGFEKPSFHVIGNHDCDDLINKDELLKFWGEEHGPYYSFDMGGFHFVVLDCNFMNCDGKLISKGRDYAEYVKETGREGDRRYISEEQLEWLKKDLETTPYPSILFSHQRLSPERTSIKNNAQLREIIDNAPNKVLMSINGHEHVDELEKFGDIWYYNINCMSCCWIGEEPEARGRFDEELEKQYPWLWCVVPHKKALYAIITMDEDGALVKGVKGEYVGKTPQELGVFDIDYYVSQDARVDLTPSIEDRYIPFK